ncbi:VOC family protein [Ningiella sp. W23]|uniref:VOC family protein n=1 Tax=Ningiella sp. W23 TaxID=3023715 RepID=UPI003757D503
MTSPFHLAIPVTDLDDAVRFYEELIGCERGRSDSCWIDWNFYGHQLVTHLVEAMPNIQQDDESLQTNEVDSHNVPVPHFGIVLAKHDWQALSARLEKHGYAFHIKPYIRFKGQVGEQGTFFLFDPSGNALEFKYFEDMKQLFAS